MSSYSERLTRVLTVTRHGDEVVVVLSKREYLRLTGQTLDFKDFLLSAPDLDELDIQRNADHTRAVDL